MKSLFLFLGHGRSNKGLSLKISTTQYLVVDAIPNVNAHNGLLQLVITDIIVFYERNIAVIKAAPLVFSFSVSSVI
jgi:hypothetical protein